MFFSCSSPLMKPFHHGGNLATPHVAVSDLQKTMQP